jgi:hypothetical protein
MGIEKFNNTIDIWLNELYKFNIGQLLAKPDDKSWSIGQVYQHLLNETNWYNGQIIAALQDKESINKETSKEAKALFERGSFEDKRFQGDPLISENVKPPESITQLKSDFEKLKRETFEIWIKIQNITQSGKSEHPGIGYLDCFQWLQYAEMHMRHHLKQKERIEKALNFNQEK